MFQSYFKLYEEQTTSVNSWIRCFLFSHLRPKHIAVQSWFPLRSCYSLSLSTAFQVLSWKKLTTKQYQILGLPQPTLSMCFHLYSRSAKPAPLRESHWRRRDFSSSSGETPEHLAGFMMIHWCTYQEMALGRQQRLRPQWNLKAELFTFFTFMSSALLTLETTSETITHSSFPTN